MRRMLKDNGVLKKACLKKRDLMVGTGFLALENKRRKEVM